MSLDRFRKAGHRPDYLFIALIFALLGIGLIMISSASVVISYQNHDTNFYYVSRQFFNLLIGLVAFIITAVIDYRYWRKIATPLYTIGIIFLILVFIPPFGVEAKGANRWLDFGIIGFQASEFMKLALIIYLANWLANKKDQINNIVLGLVPYIAIFGLVCLLVVIEPDMGTAIVIFLIALIMYFLAGGAGANVTIMAMLGLLAAMVFILKEPFRLNRVKVFLDPTQDLLGSGYHINQAFLAIGSGGLWGLGFGQSRQKYLYLPEPHTDSIFAIMSEELGFVRSVAVLFLLFYFIVRGFQIARAAPDYYGYLLAAGIMTWIAVQTLLNLAAMLSIVPLTGIPLPLMSYGGSSSVILLAALGIVVNISKFSGVKR